MDDSSTPEYYVSTERKVGDFFIGFLGVPVAVGIFYAVMVAPFYLGVSYTMGRSFMWPYIMYGLFYLAVIIGIVFVVLKRQQLGGWYLTLLVGLIASLLSLPVGVAAGVLTFSIQRKRKWIWKGMLYFLLLIVVLVLLVFGWCLWAFNGSSW